MLREALTLDRLRAMAPNEAAAYFVTHRDEGLTETEQSLLAQWLAADEAHRQAIDRADRALRVFDASEGDELLAAMRTRARAARSQRWPGWRHWPRAVAAASVLLLVAAASLLLVPSLRPASVGSGNGQAAWREYASAHAQVRNIALPDGSILTLDADSVAQVRFASNERSIRLARGRAFFEVAKNPARPFAVAAAGRRVVALGTRFEVALGEDVLRVALFKGRVAVEPLAAGPQTVVLTPGQQFVEQGGMATVRPIAAGRDDQPGWRKGLIDLDDTPLVEAVAEVNRYSRDRIILRDPAVAAMRITGQFRAGDAERFAQTVSQIHPLRVIHRENEIDLVRAN